MNFEEWYSSTYSKGCSDSHRLSALTGFNAAIDEAVKVANRKLRGITPECRGYNRCSVETMKKLKELKNV